MSVCSRSVAREYRQAEAIRIDTATGDVVVEAHGVTVSPATADVIVKTKAA